MIDLRHISVKKQDKIILDAIDWQTKQGEQWVLLGANGAGKTTLLQVILGYLWPTSGDVTVLGQRHGECDLRELRKRIGYVSVQMDMRLEGEELALNLVASGKSASYLLFEKLSDNDRVRAELLLSEMGASEITHKRYQQLSQGERQKVLIARALMANPDLLVLDEPCTGLDFPSREQILHDISKMVEKSHRLFVYVTHYPEEIVPGFTHVAVLSKGKMLASGKKEAVLTDEVMSIAYDIPVSVKWVDERPLIRLKNDLRG